MKIAIPTREKNVDDHFGHCEYYTIVTVNDQNLIEKSETFAAPTGCGCKSNIAQILADMGVSVMLAGNMGAGAVAKVQLSGISVYRGCSGNVKEVAQDFINQKITDSGETCSHAHSDDHQCSH